MYTVDCIGNKTITLDDSEGKTLYAEFEKKPKDRRDVMQVGEHLITLSSVRSVIKDKVDNFKKEKDEVIDQKNRDWSQDCFRMSRQSLKEKVVREMTVRIYKGYQLSRVDMSEEIKQKLFDRIKTFFQVNPLWPRCPMEFWWPIIEDDLREQAIRKNHNSVVTSRWWEYVKRNDNEIADWCKWQKIELQTNLQETIQ